MKKPILNNIVVILSLGILECSCRDKKFIDICIPWKYRLYTTQYNDGHKYFRILITECRKSRKLSLIADMHK